MIIKQIPDPVWEFGEAVKSLRLRVSLGLVRSGAG